MTTGVLCALVASVGFWLVIAFWPLGSRCRGRTGHSAKPPLFADLIERMSPGPYVELFARAPRLGWDHWGHGYEIGEAS